ncbi:AMP-binding protein [Kitasatospora sp. RB6PN24]|uniref:class I adenylate-forming enzyme family protein n=1 Tax=Kitasatospora humi TaxID=2893891 RepID=UPI001E52DA2E|nr:AMP-binding protein [Kitasatospora humi]MCC9312339.1 AMP-binding protein [Kitasatospora humi]
MTTTITTSTRQDLAARLLAGEAQLDGQALTTVADTVEEAADRLRQAGADETSLVAQEGLQGKELLVSTLAVWRLGAVPLPCRQRPETATGRTAFVIDQSGTVRTPQASGTVAGLDSTAVLHLSSGSTGQPKLVRRGVASVLAEAEGYRVRLGMTPRARVLVPIPLMHSYGWGFAVGALLNGCDVDAEPAVRVSQLARKIDDGWGEIVGLTPPVARLLTDTQRSGNAAGLRAAMVGAGPVSAELETAFQQRFGLRLSRGYGSSETGAIFIGEHGIGRPIPGIEVVHPAVGARGELRLRTRAPIEGYLGDEAPGPVWHTGDIVDHDESGTVFFVERARPALRLNGQYVDAQALEKALRTVPGTSDVHLFTLAREATPELEDLFAVVAGPDVDPSGIDRALRDLAGDIPRPRVVVCNALPVDLVGKPDRQKLIEVVRRKRD